MSDAMQILLVLGVALGTYAAWWAITALDFYLWQKRRDQLFADFIARQNRER